MQHYKRDILQTVEVESVERMEKLWAGKPFLPAYLASNKKVIGWFIVEILLLYYEDFQFLLYSRIYTVVLALYLLYSAVQGLCLFYYLTEWGPIVRKGKTCYLIRWEELLENEYSVYGKTVERLFGCRTIEFSRSYAHSLKNDEWRYKARFWSIKDYRKVDEIVQSYIK